MIQRFPSWPFSYVCVGGRYQVDRTESCCSTNSSVSQSRNATPAPDFAPSSCLAEVGQKKHGCAHACSVGERCRRSIYSLQQRATGGRIDGHDSSCDAVATAGMGSPHLGPVHSNNTGTVASLSLPQARSGAMACTQAESREMENSKIMKVDEHSLFVQPRLFLVRPTFWAFGPALVKGRGSYQAPNSPLSS